MALPLFTLCLVLSADEVIPADKAAQVTRAEQKAQTEVSQKYGNKKSSELSSQERSQMIRDQAAAEKATLEKAGIDPKTWAREQLKKSRSEYAEGKEKVKALEEKEKQDAEAAAKAEKDGLKDVSVQRGFSEEEPVTLEEKQGENGEVTVEKSLPPDVANDQALASEQDRLENSGDAKDTPAPASKPARGGKGGGRRR